MNSKRKAGFTLVEVLVAMVFFLICSIGLVSFTMMSLAARTTLGKRQEAYAIALDIAERLRSLPADSPLVKPKDTNASKYLKYNSDTGELVDCTNNPVSTEMFANPLGSNLLYIYDADHDGNLASSEIYGTANPEIDHPDTSGTSVTSYDSINPVRKTDSGTTFYGIWSVRYYPCGYSNQAKIVVTVYWIEPEPRDTSVADVVSGINNRVYSLKKITVTTDRAYRVAR